MDCYTKFDLALTAKVYTESIPLIIPKSRLKQCFLWIFILNKPYGQTDF